jgi:DNA-binding GntR family transcriptional regulator
MNLRRPAGRPRLLNAFNRKGLDEDVADRLREMILKGELVAGTHLVEMDLASAHNVSQGTVRAALKILQHEGLVEHRPRRGKFVNETSADDAFEIYTLRDSLEALGARCAAERITDSGRAELKRALQSLRVGVLSGNRRRVMDLDFKFHRTIVELSGHRRLIDLYSVIEAQIRLFMTLTMTDRFHHDLTEVLSIHEPIAKAIAKGDGARAAELASRHNERDGQHLIAAMSAKAGTEGPEAVNSTAKVKLAR